MKAFFAVSLSLAVLAPVAGLGLAFLIVMG
jgi:hypothetical protein